MSSVIEIGGERFEVVSDLHTHTRYSHGRGSIEDNVKAAVSKGLKTIGISDHGPGHVVFGVSRKKLAEMKAEIQRLRRIYEDIEILFGIEANILVPGGILDVRPDEYDYFDFICAGWHFGAIEGVTASGVGNTFSNFARGSYENATRKQIKMNTDAVVNVVKTGGVKFLTHPGQRAPIDLLEVAAVCASHGTLLEINTSHMTLTPADLLAMADVGARFIINSDAHKPGRIGDFLPAEKLLNDAGLDPSLVENLRKM